MRLFIAFEILETFNSALASMQKNICAKATLPKTFHLTLKFLGEVEEKNILNIVAELQKIKFTSFDAQFSDIGAFPDTAHARVVWLGLEPKDIIIQIQKQIEAATKGIGNAAKVEKDFVPHITLARIKSVDDVPVFVNSLKSITPPKDTFRIDSFKLIKSVLTPEGPVYEVLEGFAAHQ